MWLVLACLTLLPLFAPQASYAYTFTAPDLGLGGPVPCPGDGLVRRIAPCIKETIIMAAYNNLIPFSAYIAKTVSVCCILAVIFLGVNMLSGKGSAPMRDGLMTMIKIGFVMTFTWNFGGNTLDPSGTHGGSFGAMLDVMDELLFFVAYYVINSSWFAFDYICDYHGDTDNVLLVWDTIDCAIETLVGGIYSPFTLSMGIIGFLFSCLLSNSIGFTIGMMGISLIFQLLGAVFQCVYIYLSAYMGVAFMVIISPLFIPLVLFTPTKSYFEKWLKTTTSFMIQPIIVFAYLSMLLAAFDTVVFTGDNSLLRTIAGDDAKDPDFNLNGGIGWWMLTNGGYTTRDMAGQAVNIDTKSLRAAGLLPNNSDNEGMVGDISNRMLNYAATQQQGTMNVLGVGAGAKPRFFEIDIPGETVNWEKLAQYHNYPSSTAYLLTVLISAFMAIVTGYIFLDMLKVLPFIGSRVAMGGGLSDGKELKAGLGMGENAPKLPDVGKGFKMGGGTGSTGKS